MIQTKYVVSDESGVAIEVDRDELPAFLYLIWRFGYKPSNPHRIILLELPSMSNEKRDSAFREWAANVAPGWGAGEIAAAAGRFQKILDKAIVFAHQFDRRNVNISGLGDVDHSAK
jgi:hypothetical protein